MNTSFSQLPGIIGGIGPESSNYFVSLLVKYHIPNVTKDQDHIPFILFNNPQIPDRTNFMINGINSPLPELIKTAQALKVAGATFLVMPCNTAHGFIEDIEKAVNLPFINMIKLAAEEISSRSDVTKIGLLATTGTVVSGIYPKLFKQAGSKINFIIPEGGHQENVQKAIYSIKSSSVNNQNRQLLTEEANNLVKQGAQAIILGCTEIPLSLNAKNYNKVPLIDPMELLAKATINRTLGK